MKVESKQNFMSARMKKLTKEKSYHSRRKCLAPREHLEHHTPETPHIRLWSVRLLD